ncbi:sensor histidine kinase [uncultured Massilia sp.]|uniref:sensor histidine kinase n=1 Tax=uncultured Massilia sp. TaxID=169973 RepID=UPI0025CC43E9|nr:sensor histidine kinase [uncultured Massilia sp.]
MNSLAFPTLAGPRSGLLAGLASGPTPPDAGEQEQACRRAWQLLRRAGAALPAAPRRTDPALVRQLQDAFDAASVPGTLIEAELRRALAKGPSDATLLALVLLAAVALDRLRGARSALDLAHACAALARHPAAAAVTGPVLRVHAALVLARTGPLRDAALLQAEACRIEAAGPSSMARNAVLWTGMRMLCGAPLQELLQYTEAVRDAVGAAAGAAAADAARQAGRRAGLADVAACQLDARNNLFRMLAGDADLAAPRAAIAMPDAPQFGCWLTRLQAACLRGNVAVARGALEAAAGLVTPLVPPCELLPYHLFAALALAQPGGMPAALRGQLRAHRRALQDWARRAPAHAGPLAALALAAEQDAGGGASALAAYEQAAVLARGAHQPWVAALAWERAAALCARLALRAALPSYRQLALDAWRDWGAHGRVRALMESWEALPQAPAPLAAPPADGEEARAARADTVGELGIAIAHEVNQPLAAILLHAAAARRWLRRAHPDHARALAALEQITAGARQAGDIVRSVRGLARRQCEDVSTFAIDPALAEVAQLLRALMQRQGIRFETRLQLPGRELHANRAQLQQIMMNLLLNAIEALGGVADAPRRIVLESAPLGPAQVELRVADNGPGIAPPERARIFDAMYSTKPHGTGVGLSISRTIAEAHGGRIEFAPAEPRGAIFRVVLPVRSAPATTSIAMPTDSHHA